VSALSIESGNVDFFISIDLQALALDRDGLRKYRSQNSWLAAVCAALRTKRSERFENPERSTARYDYTEERATGPTLASFEANDLMPVEIKYRAPLIHRDVEGLAVRTTQFRIGASGALSWLTVINLDRALSAQEYIEKLWAEFQSIQSRFEDQLGRFCEYWNERHPAQEHLQVPGNLIAWTRRFEIHALNISADGVESFSAANLKAIYESEELLPVLADIAAVSKLSHVDPGSYDPVRLRDLRHFDLGNRRDELWLVNSARMIQVHPDLQRPLIASFFQDVGLAVELLVQEKASLAFMEHWLDGVRMKAGAGTPASLNGGLLDAHLALDQYVEPLYMLSASANPNFESAIERIAIEMGVVKQADRVLRSLEMLVTVANTVSAFGAATDGQTISIGMKRIARYQFWVAIAQTVIAVVLLFLAFSGAKN
jgi:hypothetical protein